MPRSVLALLLLAASACEGPDRSRSLGCARFPAPRERELCDAMSAALTWQWTGHATLAPGYKPTLDSVAELACAERVTSADAAALRALRDGAPADWRRQALAGWLLEVIGAGGSTGTRFDPASPDFVLRRGCPPGR